ncbi:uncharacterized protein [Neodiprion pinetum]|uniref:Uncharacterized protein LOC107223950 n=1 Tax=Neodiprion lecontei TaxID=441921 RepID=A0A6J0BYJ4_NEOLC|nr:uncharacterized protein LOC107223950 [Neodiprion lecontei]XP_046413834.1 uncharacterized protein LOC124176502 [Neodiprion fabricii]XP_046468843.1 uncharacterized protein LOC124212626 [Neodiprion pinetum]XP_046605838.1 uncharacterized protein LOC124298192 [Neodiprion virginianus]
MLKGCRSLGLDYPRSQPPMAYSILYHILQLVVILISIVNKSVSHTAREVYHYVAEDPVPDFVLCRECGGDLADSHYLVNRLSPEALIKSNQTLFGREEIEVQLLSNPLGIQFYVFTTSSAKCVSIGENWHNDFSWFPGYAWKLCFCSQCGSHVGWMFEPLKTATEDRSLPSAEGFYALVLDSVISETFSNSLLVVPKLYRN